MMDCGDLKESLSRTIGEAFRCQSFGVDGLRVYTPFAYPNGDVIDIYVVQQQAGIVATDFGEALRYLSSINVSIDRGKRSYQFADFLKLSGVRNTRGNLVVDLPSGDEASAILRLCEAIVRVGDLGVSSRQRQITAEFNAVLRPRLQSIAGDLPIADDPEFYGLSGEVYHLAFEIARKARPTGLVVATLTGRDYNSADEQVDETIRTWDDLDRIVSPDRRVNIIDTRHANTVWRDEWFRQLSKHGPVIPFDDLETLRPLLAA